MKTKIIYIVLSTILLASSPVHAALVVKNGKLTDAALEPTMSVKAHFEIR